MDDTPNLSLPYILPAQAQKHVTHNEAIRALDAIVQIGVIDRDLNVPPGSPADGDRYIVAAGATGDWAGQDGQIAAFQDGAWTFYPPQEGWLAWVADEDELVAWNGTAWVIAGGSDTSLNPATGGLVGINTTADDTNRLSVKSDAVLHSHDDVTPGSGDVQHKLNKASAGGTASFLFQTGFSGRAEFGTTGDDDWHVKVSPDGATWFEALIADRNNGRLSIQGMKSVPANFADMSSVLFTPGGDGVVSFYRVNIAEPQNPRTMTVSAIAGDVVTLTASVANAVISPQMTGVAYVRIWNTTLSADQHDAWASEFISATEFRVHDAADLAGWQAGDTVQVGDPTTITPGRCITLDISPMLTQVFGAPFRQTGLIAKGGIVGDPGDKVEFTPDGASGSFVPVTTTTSAGVAMIPCTELSPISNSNLVRVRENLGANPSIRLMSSMAVLI